MNIQQYYEQSAAASLNASLVALIPAILILMYSVIVTHMYQLVILMTPFLIYSYYCYQIYSLNQKRSKAVSLTSLGNVQAGENLFDGIQLLITFLPAPSLRLLFFSPAGTKAGEIRDKSFFLIRWFLPYFLDRLSTKKFILYDQDDQPIVCYHQHRDRIEIVTVEGKIAATLYQCQRGKRKEFLLENNSVTIEKIGWPADYLFVDSNNQKIAEIQTGLMPLEWGKRFVNPNTPILTIDKECSKLDKIQLFALCISIYAFREH